MIVIVDTVAEANTMRQAIDAMVWKLGDEAPAGFRAAEVIVRDQSRSSALNVQPQLSDLSDDRPMTDREVAAATCMSMATVRRRVADGTFTRVGRRISAPSVRRYLKGHPS